MELDSVRVQNYRCIDDSGWVTVGDISCFIGRNESGKTSFLEAIEQLNPDYEAGGYDPYEDYPRQDWREYDPETDETAVVVEAKLTLDDDDVAAVEDEFRSAILASETVVVGRDYAEDYHWEVDIDEAVALEYVAESYDLDSEVESALRDAESLGESDNQTESAVVDAVGEEPMATLSQTLGETVLADRLPLFRYIGEYATLEGTIDVQGLLDRRDAGSLTPSDRAFLSLLGVADLDIASFDSVDDWREVTAELEAASSELSDEAMRYWSQSGDISIRIQHATTDDENSVLDLRVENHKHNVTVEFEQRSQGFRRFFSLFCQLSALQDRDDDLVVMVDEPARSLHVRAKREFLVFLTSEITPQFPLLYTTHSPFMIDPERAHETKMVMSEPHGETNVFTDVTLADRVTKFPLRTVFESDLMDTVLVTPYALVVTGKADHVYLSVLSALLEEEGTDGLDSRWTVVPVRNHENIETFEGLFGKDRLEIAALLSTAPSRTNRERQESADDVPVTLVSEYTDQAKTTTEDLFSESFYLDLVSRTYASAISDADVAVDRITPETLEGNGPILERLDSYFTEHGIAGGSFDRHEPALQFQENRDELADELDKGSMRTFARVFRDLNRTLTSFEGVESERSSFLDVFRP